MANDPAKMSLGESCSRQAKHRRMTQLVIRLAMLMVISLISSACSRAPDASAKIVGTWEFTAFGLAGQQTYSKDGTMRLLAPGQPAVTGTWSITGDRLTIVFRDGNETKTTVAKVLQLDDSVLIYEVTDEEGTEASTWKRVR
jgi:hypothetical protein